VNSRSVAIVAITALTASGCGVGVHFADYRNVVTPADDRVTGTVTALQVEADDGHVVVRTGTGDGVTIHRVVHYQSGTPHPGQQLTDGTLTFVKGCTRCRVDYDLTVPASVSVRARTDSGRINVVGVKAADLGSDSGSVTARHIATDVTAHSDSGSLTVQDAGGVLEAGTDSGSIRATELRSATTKTSSDSGGVRLEFTAVPTTVRASTDSGSVRVALPDGTYDVDARTDSGGKHITVPTASTAPSKIYLNTDSGGVNVVPAA
jgi:Putative adhesin